MTKEKTKHPQNQSLLALWNGHHSAIGFEFLWDEIYNHQENKYLCFERYLNNGDTNRYLSKIKKLHRYFWQSALEKSDHQALKKIFKRNVKGPLFI